MDQNKCAQLKVEDHYSKSSDTLGDLMKIQKEIQENVYGYNFNALRRSNVSASSFFLMNYEAIQDELREFRNAMGGKLGSAIWKPWKSNHVDSLNSCLEDMSEEDRLELQYELIDIQHFVFNLALMIDLTPQEFFNLYYAKNKENMDRQKRGY